MAALEIETGTNFAHGALDRVVDLGQRGSGNDIERRHGWDPYGAAWGGAASGCRSITGPDESQHEQYIERSEDELNQGKRNCRLDEVDER